MEWFDELKLCQSFCIQECIYLFMYVYMYVCDEVTMMDGHCVLYCCVFHSTLHYIIKIQILIRYDMILLSMLFNVYIHN